MLKNFQNIRENIHYQKNHAFYLCFRRASAHLSLVLALHFPRHCPQASGQLLTSQVGYCFRMQSWRSLGLCIVLSNSLKQVNQLLFEQPLRSALQNPVALRRHRCFRQMHLETRPTRSGQISAAIVHRDPTATRQTKRRAYHLAMYHQEIKIIVTSIC